MRYAVLIYDKPGTYEGLEPAEAQRATSEFATVTQDPGVREGAQLQPVTTATTVRVKNGETLLTDGPFAETKEILGGYYVIDVADIDAAVAFAQQIPSARLNGSVELRPIVER